jgi:hypothetical protein
MVELDPPQRRLAAADFAWDVGDQPCRGDRLVAGVSRCGEASDRVLVRLCDRDAGARIHRPFASRRRDNQCGAAVNGSQSHGISTIGANDGNRIGERRRGDYGLGCSADEMIAVDRVDVDRDHVQAS